MLKLSLKIDLELNPDLFKIRRIDLLKMNRNIFNINNLMLDLESPKKFYIKIPSCSSNINSLIEDVYNANFEPYVIIAKSGFYFDKEMDYFLEKHKSIEHKNVYPLLETNDIFNISLIKKLRRNNIKEVFIGRNDLTNIMKNDKNDIERIVEIYKNSFKTYVGGFSESIIENRKPGDCNSLRKFILDGSKEKDYTEKEKELLRKLLKENLCNL